MNGYYLKYRRNQLGLAASSIAGIPSSDVYRYETGERLATMQRAELMADALGIPMKWLVSVPTLTDMVSLGRYFIEMFTPGLTQVSCYLEDDPKYLFLSPAVAEKVSEWVKIKKDFDTGILSPDEYGKMIFGLIDEQKSQTKKANLASDVLKRARIIVNLTGALDPELPGRLLQNDWRFSKIWGTGIDKLSLPEIEQLSIALRVPVEYLTEQFFFETDDDLLAFLLHIELSNRDREPIIIPTGSIPDVKIEVNNTYLRTLFAQILPLNKQYANKEINHIQYINKTQSLIRKY